MALTTAEEIEMLELENEQIMLSEDTASEEDLDRGSFASRMDRGITALPRGAFQLGANIGDFGLQGIIKAEKAMGILDEDFEYGGYGDQVNKEEQDYAASERRGQKALGDGTFNAAGLTGEILTGGLASAGMKGLKGALKAGTLIGGLTPTASEDFWSNKAMQTGAGGLMGGLGYGAVKGITHGAGGIRDLYKYYTQSGKDLLGTTLKKTLGDKADDVATKLELDYNPLTPGSAAEVASDAGSTKFAAMQQAADDLAPDQAFARKAAQDAQRMQVIDDIADVKIQGRQPEEFREAIAGPLREKALTNAASNTAKERMLTKTLSNLDDPSLQTNIPQPHSGPTPVSGVTSVANSVRNAAGLKGARGQAENLAGKQTTPWGGKIPKRYAPQQGVLEKADDLIDEADLIEAGAKQSRSLVKGQLDEMADKGIKGSKPNSIIEGIDEALGTPKLIGNSAVTKLMKTLKSDLQKMVGKDGTIHPESLYEFRMNTIDLKIEQALSKVSSAQRQRVTSQLSAIKPLLDDVIESAAGGGWKKYLRTFSKLSRPVNQAKIGKKLQEAMTNDLAEGQLRSGMLAKTIAAEKATMKKSGVRGEEFDEVLYARQNKGLNKTLKDLQRSELTKRQAAEASQTKGDVKDIHVPQMGNALIRPIMIGNFISKKIMQGRVKEVEELLVELFQRNPTEGYRALAAAIRKAPPEAQKTVREFADKYGGQIVGGSAGVGAGQIGEL